MRLSFLNDGEEAGGLDPQGMGGGYTAAKTKGNITRKQANDNPDKSEPDDSIPHQTDRSGNQYAVAITDPRKKKFLGAAEGDRDKMKPPNLA